MRHLRLLIGLLSCMSLLACKKHEIQPSCSETVPVIERNGYKVYETLDGLYLKANEIGMSRCSSRPYSEAPWQANFVAGINQYYYWANGRLMRTTAELLEAGLVREQVSRIELYINFDRDRSSPQYTPPPGWWYAPTIPHQRYPIDLLPNFGLDRPDPNAGVGKIQSRPSVYWAVRGTKRPDTGMPFTTFCSIRPPPNNAQNDVAYQTDARWLVQGETYSQDTIGNTCRGGVSATNNKLGATIDVPGAALRDIDKIYQAVSLKLTELTVQ